MINTLLVCDSNNATLGDFFEKCQTVTEQLLTSSDLEINCISISGNVAFNLAVPMNANSFNNNPFLFISYTHGSESELLQNGNTPFLSTTYETESLNNSIAYCYACKAGVEFGKAICETGALCFIGYKENATIQKFFGAEDSFIECATWGIKALIEGNTTGQALSEMKEKHTECIDEFYPKDMLTASIFMENRDALVIHGNSELTLNDM